MTTNPFHHGQAITADHRDAFVDREQELATVVGCMLNARNLILTGPRRYGKTSLLYLALDSVTQQSGRTGRATLSDCATPKDVAEALLAGVLAGPVSWRDRSVQALSAHLRGLRATASLEVGPQGTIKVALATVRREQGWREVIADVLGILRSTAEEDPSPVSFVIDEFQRAAEIDAAIPGVVKRIADEIPDVGLILSGSRRHLMEQLTTGPAAPLARIGTNLALDRIPREVMVEFLVRRASVGGRLLGHSQAEAIHDRAAGIPNDVQHLAFWAFAVCQGRRIGPGDVDEAVRRLIIQSRFEFITVFDGLAASQQKLVKALAADGAIRSLQDRAMTDRLELANPSGVMRAARALEARDVIEQTAAGWQLINPFFGIWLRDWAGRD